MNQEYFSDTQLAKRYGVSRQTPWRWVREGRFPDPIKLSECCTRWSLASIKEWEQSLRENSK